MLAQFFSTGILQLLRLMMVLHVGSKNAFPKPLPAKEELECLKRMKQGDTAAKSLLIEHNLRLVVHIINNI